MGKRPAPAKGGLTPGKTVMIGVLAVVLLVVIATQFGGNKKTVVPQPRTRRTASNQAESNSSPASSKTGTTAKRSENSWPQFDLAAVIASNPFRLPEALTPHGAEGGTAVRSSETEATEASVSAIDSDESLEMRRRQAEFMASLRAKGVDMILRSPRGSVARIGDLSLRVGDVHEGLRVEEIGAQGVVFAPAAAEGLQAK